MQQDTEIDEYANVMCNKTQEHKYLIRHMQQNIGMNEYVIFNNAGEQIDTHKSYATKHLNR